MDEQGTGGKELNLEKLSEVFYRVLGPMNELAQLKKDMSFMVPGSQFSPAFKNHTWDGRVSFFDARRRTIPAGLYPMVYKICKERNFDLRVDDFVKADQINDPKPDTEAFIKSLNLPFAPREYQIQQFEKAITHRRGVICSPTGSGKSLVIYLCVRWLLENMSGKILLVVPTVSLVEQMWSDFKDYGWTDVDEYGEQLYSGKEPTFKKRFLLTTYQSIMKKDMDFFESYTTLMNDEAHSVKSAMLMKIAKMCQNARYRLGFTATVPNEPIDYLNIYGMLGWKIYDLKSYELIDQGYLSRIKVVNLFLEYSEATRKRGSGRSYAEEVNLLEDSDERLQGFAYILDNLPETQNTLILVNHIRHLKKMQKWLEETYKDKFKIHVIQGATDPIAREGIRQGMENEKGSVLLATYGTMSTGINIKRIHHIIFGASSKSPIRVLQSIGRGLRLHESKDKLILWDVVDDLSTKTKRGNLKLNYMMKHWNERFTEIYGPQKFECLKKTLNLNVETEENANAQADK